MECSWEITTTTPFLAFSKTYKLKIERAKLIVLMELKITINISALSVLINKEAIVAACAEPNPGAIEQILEQTPAVNSGLIRFQEHVVSFLKCCLGMEEESFKEKSKELIPKSPEKRTSKLSWRWYELSAIIPKLPENKTIMSAQNFLVDVGSNEIISTITKKRTYGIYAKLIE